MGSDPKAAKLEEEFQNGTCQHLCLCGRTSSPKWPPLVSVAWGESQLPPASTRNLAASVGRSDPGSFPVTAFALNPRAWEIFCAPFKSDAYVSHRLQVSQK